MEDKREEKHETQFFIHSIPKFFDSWNIFATQITLGNNRLENSDNKKQYAEKKTDFTGFQMKLKSEDTWDRTSFDHHEEIDFTCNKHKP